MKKFIVIAGPTGVGKDAVIEGLVDRHPDWVVAPSATTRPKRRFESAKKRYYFVTNQEFEALIKTGKLLEWEEVHTWRYGTLKQPVVKALEKGGVVLLNMEPKRGRALKAAFAQYHPLLVLLQYDHSIPLDQAIKNRFRTDPKRRTLSSQEMEVRIRSAREEQDLSAYDAVIENKEHRLQDTVTTVEQFILGNK